MGHDTPQREKETLGTFLRESHIHGDLAHSEHRLLYAVFEFDDIICRRIMVRCRDVAILSAGQSLSNCLVQERQSRHTRFPLCERSLDKVVGVIRIRELIRQTDVNVDTFSRLLMSRHGEILEAGEHVTEVPETKNSREERVRVTLNNSPADPPESSDSVE